MGDLHTALTTEYSLATKAWTLDELHRLPDDGNKYELVRGELFVTPAPSPGHEYVAVRLARCLERYVESGIPEYWIVDPDARSVTVVRRDTPDTVTAGALTSHPGGATAPLELDARQFFGDV